MSRARKAWAGGKPPEPSDADKALLEHVNGCERCAGGRWMFGHCDDGTRLYKAVQAQYVAAVKVPGIEPKPIALRSGHRGRPEDVDMNKPAFQLLGMAVTAIRQLEAGNPFAKMAVGDFRRAMGYADISEEYVATLDPLALPLRDVESGVGKQP